MPRASAAQGTHSSQLAPYVDPESSLLVQPIEAAAAMRAMETMPCLVHLLPQFRIAEITKYADGGEPSLYLSGCSPKNGGARSTGFVLYR